MNREALLISNLYLLLLRKMARPLDTLWPWTDLIQGNILFGFVSWDGLAMAIIFLDFAMEVLRKEQALTGQIDITIDFEIERGQQCSCMDHVALPRRGKVETTAPGLPTSDQQTVHSR